MDNQNSQFNPSNSNTQKPNNQFGNNSNFANPSSTNPQPNNFSQTGVKPAATTFNFNNTPNIAESQQPAEEPQQQPQNPQFNSDIISNTTPTNQSFDTIPTNQPNPENTGANTPLASDYNQVEYTNSSTNANNFSQNTTNQTPAQDNLEQPNTTNQQVSNQVQPPNLEQNEQKQKVSKKRSLSFVGVVALIFSLVALIVAGVAVYYGYFETQNIIDDLDEKVSKSELETEISELEKLNQDRQQEINQLIQQIGGLEQSLISSITNPNQDPSDPVESILPVSTQTEIRALISDLELIESNLASENQENASNLKSELEALSDINSADTAEQSLSTISDLIQAMIDLESDTSDLEKIRDRFEDIRAEIAQIQ